MKGKLLLPQETVWRPSGRQVEARETLLYKLRFERFPGAREWRNHKAIVTYELVTTAHDEVFVQVLQIALMQNFIEPIRRYMVNSDETV